VKFAALKIAKLKKYHADVLEVLWERSNTVETFVSLSLKATLLSGQ